MKRYLFFLIICFISLNSYCQVSDNIQSEFNVLKSYASTYGTDSKKYNDYLLDLCETYADTCYSAYYGEMALSIVNNFQSIRKIYPIDGIDYRMVMIYLNRFLMFGKYADNNYLSYRDAVVEVMLSMEKDLPKSGDNKEEFLAMLASVYYYGKNDCQKELHYTSVRLKMAEKNRLENTQNYAYALSFYIHALSHNGKIKSLNKQIEKAIKINDMSKECKQIVLNNLMLVLNTNTNENVWITLTKIYAENNGSLSVALGSIWSLAKVNRAELMARLDSILTIHYPPIERIRLYQTWGNLVGAIAHNYLAAAKYHTKAILLADSIRRSDLNFSKNSGGIWINAWQRVSKDYYLLGIYENAASAEEKALSIFEEVLGKNSVEWIECAQFLASIYSYNLSNYERTIKLEQDIISQMKLRGDYSTDKIFDAYYHLMGSLRMFHRADDAIRLADSILIAGNLSGEQQFKLHNQMGMCHSELSHWQESKAHYLKALNFAPTKQDEWVVIRNLSGVYKDLGEYETASAILNIIEKEIMKNGSNRDKFDICESKSNLSITKKEEMHYLQEAEKYIDESFSSGNVIRHYQKKVIASPTRYEKLQALDKALELFYQTNQQDSVLLGKLIENKAQCYAEACDYFEAEKLYSEAFECLKVLHYTDESFLTLCHNMCFNILCIRDYQRPLCIRCLKLVTTIRRETLGPKHPVYQNSMRLLFNAYLDISDYEHCDSVIAEYSRIASTPCDPKLLIMKGELHFARKRYHEAFRDYDMALAMEDSEDERNVIRGKLSDVFKALGWKNEYVNNLDNEYTVKKKSIAENYYNLTRAERKKQTFILDNYFNYLMKNIKYHPKISNIALDFSLFIKGLQFRTENEFNRVVRNDKEKYEKFLSMKKLQTQAISSGDSIMSKKYEEQIERYERQLLSSIKNVNRLKESLIVTKDDVLKSLPKEALAINFVRYTVDSVSCYGAFLIGKDSTRFVKICNETELQSVLTYDANGDFVAAKLRKCIENVNGNGLYRHIWKPLEEYMRDYSTIFFSGAGLLDAIPIEYLKDNERNVMTDKYNLHRVFSLTDIKKPLKMGNNVLAIGVADYNSPVIGVPTDTRGGLNDLPEVKIEIENIQKIVDGKNCARISSWLDNKAREDSVKTRINADITTLHIASHAFYKSPKYLEFAAANPQNADHYAAIRFLKTGMDDCSAIVLRQGNLTWYSPEVTMEDDDILTSEEIEQLYLPQLNLVVLSACQTGQGKSSIEGVGGLQRAFRIAGTKSLICSTRQVNSVYAEKFMSELYQHLANEETIYSAFHAARLSLYEEYKKMADVWSSFILIE